MRNMEDGPWRTASSSPRPRRRRAGIGALYSEQEAELRKAWTRYFDSVAIAERANPKLQANHMPKKYWADLPELSRP